MKSWCYKKNKLKQFDHFTCGIPSLQKFNFLGLILCLHFLWICFDFLGLVCCFCLVVGFLFGAFLLLVVVF